MPRCFHSPEWPTGAHGTWNFSVMPTGVDLDATEATPATPNPQTEIPQSRHSMSCSPRKDYGLMKWRCEMSNRAAQLLKISISRRMMLTQGSQLRCLRALLLSFCLGVPYKTATKPQPLQGFDFLTHQWSFQVENNHTPFAALGHH